MQIGLDASAEIMSIYLRVLALFSLALNLLFAGVGAIFVAHRGGISYLKEQLRGSAPDAQGEKYFNERRSIFEAMPPRPGAIVFLGDSLTERCPWNELLQRGDVIARGIGGQDLDGVLKNVSEVARHKPAKIFIMAGTNDIVEGKTNQQIVNRYRTLLNNLKRQSPRTVIVVQSIFPMGIANFSQDPANLALQETRSANQNIAAINKQLRRMTDGKTVIYCDVAGAVKHGGQLNPKLTSDGLHLNAKGYLKWKQVLLPLLGATPNRKK